ncbi:FAD-dependent oxidoreductase [Allorhizobium taibaishanense]|uniref:2-polyprenyl-6-methoxyphenol hydroxylase n=1 Tax=Allorhizobium taibaishanense TaxID=887144 RepID=A0A1Q9A0L0_9HYPH|nr:NAD(P)/FAD-dependent oxidoreductase [Allorhizobium taibaishanense]MBB4007753.1 2-polyprenyl-6-methoxyphenol hydroxylase-like FAD-dependent oxidoreductase [Allorhizobium taibaishanense]OLP48102.1 2-polyprenyl-6-methoxyphenol hydroxylase [Allorhizobium taibaishanense]
MKLSWRVGRRVAVVGAGPGGLSAALALTAKGYDVRIFERHQAPRPLGGAVLLSVPVLAMLRQYGVDLSNFGSYTSTHFRNQKGKLRAALPFNAKVEEQFGIKGWHYGVLRSSAFSDMLKLVPEGMIVGGYSLKSYDDSGKVIRLHFEDQETVDADMLIGADGVNSVVSKQAFGDPGLFHVGIRVWLAWCNHFEGVPANTGWISHSRQHQASFFPMLHDGKPGFEWWVVEPSSPTAPVPSDPKAHVTNIVSQFANPMPRFPAHTDFSSQMFRWEVYNRPSLKAWSKGRVVCLGDAVHPVSPYAAYGMGMAIEDGYFIAKYLDGRDLSDLSQLKGAFAEYEAQRVAYCNHHVELARRLGKLFHRLPAPLAVLRDLVYDNTKLLERTLSKDYLKTAEDFSIALTELHVKNVRDQAA